MSKKCEKCGSYALDDALECPYCGEVFNELIEEVIDKSTDDEIKEDTKEDTKEDIEKDSKEEIKSHKKKEVNFLSILSVILGIGFVLFWVVYFLYIALEAINFLR